MPSLNHAEDDHNSNAGDIIVEEQGHHENASVVKAAGGTSLTSEKSSTSLTCTRAAEVRTSDCDGIAIGVSKARSEGVMMPLGSAVVDNARKVENQVGSRGDSDNRTGDDASGTEETGSSSSSLNSSTPASLLHTRYVLALSLFLSPLRSLSLRNLFWSRCTCYVLAVANNTLECSYRHLYGTSTETMLSSPFTRSENADAVPPFHT